MKRLISLIICITIIAGLVPSAMASDSVILLNETFGDTITNATPKAATVYGDGSLVTAIEDGGDKILRVRNRWETTIVHFSLSAGTNSLLVLDTKVKAEDNNSEKALLQYASTANTFTLVTRKPNGRLYDMEGSAVGEAPAGQWVRLTAVMNFVTLRYELYVDGKLVTHRGKLNKVESFTRAGFTSYENDEKETTMYCDYLKVYTGDEVLPENYFPGAAYNSAVKKTSIEHASEPKYKPSLIFEMDCESSIIGQMPNGARVWDGSSATGQDPEDSNKFLRLNYKNGSGAIVGMYSQIESYPCMVVQMDMRVNRKNAASWIIQCKDRATNSNDLRVFNVNTSGFVTAADETTIIYDKNIKDKWVNVAGVIDFRTKDIDYYINGELVLENFSYAGITTANANKISALVHEVRIQAVTSGLAGEHMLDIDNVYFYKALNPIDKATLMGGGSVMEDVSEAIDYTIDTAPINPDMTGFKAVPESISEQKNYSKYITDYVSVKQTYKDALCVVADNSNVWIKNGKYTSDYKFYWDGDHIIGAVPTLAAFANKQYSYDKATKTAKIGNVTAKAGDKFITVDGKEYASVSANVEKDGVLYIPLREYVRYGMNKVYGESTKGFGVIANDARPYHFNPNPGGTALVSTVAEYSHMMAYLILDRYNADTLMNIFNERIKGTPYPRVSNIVEEAPVIKAATETDPLMKQFSDMTLSDANAQLRKVLNIPDNPGEQINGLPAITTPEMMYYAYYMTGDRAYIDKTIEFAKYLLNLQHWNGEAHMLSASWICLYLANTYDIFKDELPKELRDEIVFSCTEKAIKVHREFINGTVMNTINNWATKDYNWNVICNAGPMLASMIFLGEGYDDALFLDTIEKAQVSLGYFMHYFSPDGGGFESPGYTNYLLSYMTPLMEGVENYFGENLGFTDYPGLNLVSTFLVNATGKQNSWAIHCDTDTVPACTALSMWFSEYFKDYEAQARNIEQLYKNLPQFNINGFTLLKNYMPNPPEVEYTNQKLDVTYRGMQLGASRDGHGDSQQIFLGVHGGYNNDAGMQQDIGNFFYEINGKVFADDTGREDYSIQGSPYPNRPEGHNVWVVNPDEGIGQNLIACGKVKLVESKPKGVIYTLDMLPAYYGMVDGATRGYMLSDDRKIFTLQDEIQPSVGSNEFYWFWHSPSEIEIDEENNTVTLEQDGQICTLYLDSNVDFIITKQDTLEPLPRSPKIEGQLQQPQAKKQKKIVVNFFSEGEPVTFRAVAVPYGYKYERQPLTPISEWSIPDGSTTEGYTDADMIYINGQPLENFRPDVYDYSMYYPGYNAEPVITVDTKGKVAEIISRTDKSDTVVVRIESADVPGNFRTYTITLQSKACVGMPEGTEHSIVGAKASANDGNVPENVFDGDMTTRWSSEENQWITLDLGSEKEFNTLALALFGEDGRRLDYEVWVSDDDNEYTLVADDLLTSGIVYGWEYTQFNRVKARYIKLTCHGSTIIKYNSILEMKVFDVEQK